MTARCRYSPSLLGYLNHCSRYQAQSSCASHILAAHRSPIVKAAHFTITSCCVTLRPTSQALCRCLPFSHPTACSTNTVTISVIYGSNYGWVRASITSERCNDNRTGCFCCSLHMIKEFLCEVGGSASIIPFSESTDLDGRRIYSTAWDTDVYQSYCITVTNGHVVLVDYYSDWATLAKSGTQSATILRVRVSNFKTK